MTIAVLPTLDDGQLARLDRLARTMDMSRQDAAALLIEEGLRLREFPGIEFRDTAIGRQPYLRGSRITIWQLALISRDYDGDVAAVADHLGLPEASISAALPYVQAFANEIDAAIDDIRAAEDRLVALLPPDHVITV